MSYLLPAGNAPRTKNKWGLGAVLMRNGSGGGLPVRSPISFPITVGPVSTGGPPNPPNPTPPLPSIFSPVLPGPAQVWHPIATPIFPRYPITGGPGSTPTSNAGTPVPVGFPTNQFYVAPDGSVWEYSTSSNQWFNTGTPYSASPATVTTTSPVPAGFPTSSAYTDPNGNIWTWNGSAWTISGSVQTGGAITPTSAPISVSVAPATTDSGYQSILDWLTQQTLISSFPNWMVLAAGAVAYKMFFASPGKGR